MIDKAPILAIPPKVFGDKHFAAEFNKFRMFLLSLADEANKRALGYTGSLRIADSMPTIPGLYKLMDFGTYTNLIPAVDASGNPSSITAFDGKINEAYYDGTKWVNSKITLPQASQNLRIYEDIPNGTILNEKEQVISNNVTFIVKDGETAVVGTDFPTGDKFKSFNTLKDDVINLSYTSLKDGVLSNVDGSLIVVSSWKSTPFIECVEGDLFSTKGQITGSNFAIFFYDENENFLAKKHGVNSYEKYDLVIINDVAASKFVKVQTLSESHTDYQPFAFEFRKVRKSEFTKLKDNVDGEIIEFDKRILQNGVLSNIDGSLINVTSWKSTPFIPTIQQDEISIETQIVGNNFAIFFYDENENYLFKKAQVSTGFEFINTTIKNDVDAKYFKVQTLSQTHPDYQVQDFKFSIIRKSINAKVNADLQSQKLKIDSLESIDLELQLKDLLISRDEHISKIEAGDYGIVVNANDFKIGTQTQRLQRAIQYIKMAGKGVLELTADTIGNTSIWSMTESLLMPSNFTLLIRNGVTLKKTDGIFDTLLRNDGIIINPAQPYGVATELKQNENIHIILEDTAYINDLDVAKNAPHPINGGAPVNWDYDAFGWRTLTLLFANCKNYSVKGGNFNNGKCWSISNENGCENFVYDGIDFQTRKINGDGIDVRTGCKNFIIKNISGNTNDDLVALSCVTGFYPEMPMQVGGFSENSIFGTEIKNGNIYNITGSSATHLLIMLIAGINAKMSNIKAGKIHQTTTAVFSSPVHSVVDVFTGYVTPAAVMGNVHDIYVNNIRNLNFPEGALHLSLPIQNSFFNKIESKNPVLAVQYGSEYVEGSEVFIENSLEFN